MPHRDPGAVLLGHDELDLVLRADRHLQAAEIYPLPGRDGLPGVPRAALGSRFPRGPRGRLILGQLVVSLVIEFIVSQALRIVLRPVTANVR